MSPRNPSNVPTATPDDSAAEVLATLRPLRGEIAKVRGDLRWIKPALIVSMVSLLLDISLTFGFGFLLNTYNQHVGCKAANTTGQALHDLFAPEIAPVVRATHKAEAEARRQHRPVPKREGIVKQTFDAERQINLLRFRDCRGSDLNFVAIAAVVTALIIATCGGWFYAYRRRDRV